jgi:DNA-directed RNA polymerase specialized sigma24 family protein
VYRIAVNKSYDQLRKQKRHKEERFGEREWEIISNHLSEEVNTELENMENARIINMLTNRLSPRQKTVFVLSELEGLDSDE